MYKLNFLIVALVLIGSTFFLNSCSDDSSTPSLTEYIADDNSFKDFASWKLEATKKGPDPALGMAHGGNDETVTRKIYNKDGKRMKGGEYPVGTVIVKQSTNTAGTLNEITAMVKRGNDFNPAAGDWEWFMLAPDGTIGKDGTMPMRGANLMNGMCAGCHAGASAKDLVFTIN
jgi:hypothetical protein